MLREYIMPNVSKNEFRARLTAAIDDDTSESQAAAPSIAQRPPELPQETNSPAPAPDPVVITPARSASASDAPSKPEQASRDTPENKSSEKGKKPVYVGGSQSQPRKQEEHKDRQSPMDSREKSQEKDTKGNSPIRAAKKEKLAHEPPARRPTQPTGPPTQYRLQVRLFDGSSVRSTFSPTQTIHKDVRPWLDGQLEEKKPYNLKHILTPLPNKTLTITEEDQTLRELITGSTATFVMVPIKTYIDAYSESGSLPVRALSSAYGLVTSVISGTVGYVGSFVGYAQNTVGPSQPEPARPSELQPPTDSARRPRPWGPNIRTLRDQGSEQDSQFYNGNQVSCSTISPNFYSVLTG